MDGPNLEGVRVGNSLRDQLLKVGLATEKQVRSIEAEKSKLRKRARKADKSKVTTAETEEARQIAAMYRARKAEQDRELNRQREEQKRQKERAAQARDLIQSTLLKREDGEIAFNFTHGKKIKRLYLSAKQHKQLVDGSIAIASLKGVYQLVPASTAERLRELGSNLLIYHGEPPSAEEDDAYAEHPIPDDLMW